MKNLSRQWKNLERGKEEMKKQRAANKKLVIGSRIWPMSHGRTNCGTKTSLGKEVSTSGFLHSKSWSKARDGICSMSTKLRDS